MAFQRSYSKVWWGSSTEENSGLQNFHGFHSLEGQLKWSGNLSRIQEADEPSKSWSSNDSPGSLRSQDSGFSDHDEGPQLRNLPKSPSKSEGSGNTSKNPSLGSSIILGRKPEISPIKNIEKRLSISAPSSPVPSNRSCDILSQLDRISKLDATPSTDLLDKADTSCLCSTGKSAVIRRRKIVSQRPRRIFLNNSKEELSMDGMLESKFKDYNNETVYIGGGDGDDNNNLTDRSIDGNLGTPSRNFNSSQYTASTSTPKYDLNVRHTKNKTIQNLFMQSLESYAEETVFIGSTGVPSSVQYWLNDLRSSYNHEVMSILQTKSIAQEAFRNLKITTTTVAKIIRQLQTRALILQGEFERCEKILRGTNNLKEALYTTQDIINSVREFANSLEKRSVFFTGCRPDRKKFDDNLEHIRLIVRDLHISLEKRHYLDVISLFDDLQVLKRYVLLTIRLVFEKLIRVIVLNIENSKCDLMLRANLNMVSTLSNIDYTGFASLSDAFLQNDAVRVFLTVCLDSKFSSVRALALRALATICSVAEAIKELGETGGVEIIKDILSCDPSNNKRTEPEKREAVSLVAQITASWHGSGHIVPGLKDCAEGLVEGLTDIIEKTDCCQTLLLCAASLNNLSRLEVTSIYSIMSNESVIKLKEAIEGRGPGVSIFLYEQIVSMVYNMSGNKKCHSHLANRNIINFITSIFQSLFYEKFNSRAENDVHRKTIKTILHIFARLIHDSVVGQDILEQNFIPIFSRIEKNLKGDSEYANDISFLTRQMNESLLNKSFNRSTESRNSSSSGCRLNLNRQESYV